MREAGSGTRIAVEQKFADAELELKVALELGNNESIKQGISGGLGIAVLSLHMLTRRYERTHHSGCTGEFHGNGISGFRKERGCLQSPEHLSNLCTKKARHCCRKT